MHSKLQQIFLWTFQIPEDDYDKAYTYALDDMLCADLIDTHKSATVEYHLQSCRYDNGIYTIVLGSDSNQELTFSCRICSVAHINRKSWVYAAEVYAHKAYVIVEQIQ